MVANLEIVLSDNEVAFVRDAKGDFKSVGFSSERGSIIQ
jgi:hypothetical protein